MQREAAHSTRRRRRVEWRHTALAMGRWCLWWVDVGPRPQETAATLMAQVVARVRGLPLCLTDGWKASPAAVLQVVGVGSGPGAGGQSAASPHRVWALLKTCATRKECKGGTRQGTAWRSAPAWCAGGRAGVVGRGTRGLWGRPSRPLVWHGGMGRCGGWSPQCGDARAVCPGTSPVTEDASGCWCASRIA